MREYVHHISHTPRRNANTHENAQSIALAVGHLQFYEQHLNLQTIEW
jgi:hypothetical protein